MQIPSMKSHEDRIADLERQVAELKRIVGVPAAPFGGLTGIAVGAHPHPTLAQQLAEAQRAALKEQQDADPRMTR